MTHCETHLATEALKTDRHTDRHTGQAMQAVSRNKKEQGNGFSLESRGTQPRHHLDVCPVRLTPDF